jgi:para-nitrobenzyl esterase
MWDRPWREADYSVEKAMNGYWVNFVKTGNPNGEGLPEWSTYDKVSGSIMEIGDQQTLTPGLYKKQFEFLMSVVPAK